MIDYKNEEIEAFMQVLKAAKARYIKKYGDANFEIRWREKER